MKQRYTIALAGLCGLLLTTSAAHATDYSDVTTDFSNAFGAPTDRPVGRLTETAEARATRAHPASPATR